MTSWKSYRKKVLKDQFRKHSNCILKLISRELLTEKAELVMLTTLLHGITTYYSYN